MTIQGEEDISDDRHPPGRGIEVGRFGESDGASPALTGCLDVDFIVQGQLGGGAPCDAPVSAHLVPGQILGG